MNFLESPSLPIPVLDSPITVLDSPITVLDSPINLVHSDVSRCDICFDEYEHNNPKLDLPCGHHCHNACLRGHCELGERAHDKCYQPGCNGEIPLNTTISVFSPNSFDNYQQRLSNQALLSIPHIKICTGCNYAEQRPEWSLETSRGTKCPNCSHSCFLCGVSHQEGTECSVATTEARMTMDQVMAMEQYDDWTECPRCHQVFSHAGGCIHMTCVCTFEFCFRCNKPGNTIPMENAAWHDRACPCHGRHIFELENINRELDFMD